MSDIIWNMFAVIGMSMTAIGTLIILAGAAICLWGVDRDGRNARDIFFDN